MWSRVSILIVLAGAVPRLAAQQTFIVDAQGGPGSQFSEIQPAVNAASDGDIILVRNGTYAPFSVANKGLSILGDSSSGTVIAGNGDIVIGPTDSLHAVLLQDFAIQASPMVATAIRLYIHDTGGPVTVHRVTTPVSSGTIGGSHSGIELERCAQVHLAYVAIRPVIPLVGSRPPMPMLRARRSFLEISWSSIEGMWGNSSSLDGEAGLFLDQCDAFITASTFRGGDGSGLDRWNPGNGGPGIRATGGSFLVITGNPAALTVGGTGGTWQYWWWSYSETGDGGPGIELNGSSTAWFEGGATAAGGPGGQNANGTGQPGPPSTVASGSTLRMRTIPEAALASLSGTPAPGQLVQLRLQAGAGATAFLFAGPRSAYLPLAPLAVGALLIDSGGAALLGPFVLPAGQLDLALPIPALWPYLDRPIFAQFLVLDGAEVLLSNSVALVVES